MPDTHDQVTRPIDDDSVECITRFNKGAIQGLPAELQDQYVSVQSEEVKPSYLLVYAEKDRNDAMKLHDALADHLAAGDCDWQMRDWHAISVGERPEEVRTGWLQEARFVLLLLSVSLIADLKKGSISLDNKRPLLPLALKKVSPEHLQDTVIAGRMVFSAQGRDAWTSRSGAGRDEWVARAATQILARIRPNSSLYDPLDLFALRPLPRTDDCDDNHYVPQLVKGNADADGRPAIEALIINPAKT